MNVPEAIRIKMAEREGHNTAHQLVQDQNNPRIKRVIFDDPFLPTYDNDNDLDRYIRGMDERTFIKYRIALHEITKPRGQHTQYNSDMLMFQATPEQELQAIIKAEGWEDLI